MKTYLYYSKMFGCDTKITYNDNGVFVSMEIIGGEEVNKQFNPPQGTIYLTESSFKDVAQSRGLKYVEVARDITFDMFWKRYNYKDCGRTKTEEKWNKLSKEDQLKAYDFIPTLERQLKMSGLAKPYATTYLNSKRWIQ